MADFISLKVHPEARGDLRRMAAALTGRMGETVSLSEALRTACVILEGKLAEPDAGGQTTARLRKIISGGL